MKVCFVHIRLSIAAGHAIPNLTFNAPCLTSSGLSEENILFSETVEKRNNHNESPLKPSTWKTDELKRIELEQLDENEQREALLRLKGLRYDRDILIETFNNIDVDAQRVAMEEIESSTASTNNQSKEGEIINDKNINNVQPDDEAATANVVTNNVSCVTSKQTYAASVGANLPNRTTSKHKKHSSSRKENDNSRLTQHQTSIQSSPGKDDDELCDILSSASQHRCSRSNSVTGRYTPSSSIDFRSSTHGHSPKHPLTSISFFSGNPAVDITNGIIHLYKTNYKVKIGEDLSCPDTDTLCMLSVPASIDTHGLMQFTAPYTDVIHQMRIIRDRTPNQYMVLLSFISNHDACQFFLNLNNQYFSSLIPEEICHLAFVASVEALPPYESDPKAGGGFLPLQNSTELPDCMVCLERMDESVQGLLTILCNHSFHAACLRQWEDLCCPVCRYVQTPEPQSDNKCMVCGATEDLWICLICGNVGCGRYTSEHAQRHYLDTHHNYAMALSDNRVWDYAGDYFVHRLFQNKEDGKLVEQKGEEQDSKLEAIQLECMHLLTTQLESQRKYWEEQVSLVAKKVADEQEEMHCQLKKTNDKCDVMEKKIHVLEKEKHSLSQRNEHLSSKLQETLKDLSGEREMNKSLTQNQDVWKAKVSELEDRGLKQEEEITELKEQLRDIMFYIEASQKIKNEDKEVQDELRDGQVSVGQGTSGVGGQGRKKGKGRKSR